MVTGPLGHGGADWSESTCYYYPKLYYRSFWLSPPACAVSEPHARYSGESRFPWSSRTFIATSGHSAFSSLSLLTVDAVNAFR